MKVVGGIRWLKFWPKQTLLHYCYKTQLKYCLSFFGLLPESVFFFYLNGLGCLVSVADLHWRRLLAPWHVDLEWLGENCRCCWWWWWHPGSVWGRGSGWFYLRKQTVATDTLPARRLSLRPPTPTRGLAASIQMEGLFLLWFVYLFMHPAIRGIVGAFSFHHQNANRHGG